jgi:hypothetical protein
LLRGIRAGLEAEFCLPVRPSAGQPGQQSLPSPPACVPVLSIGRLHCPACATLLLMPAVLAGILCTLPSPFYRFCLGFLPPSTFCHAVLPWARCAFFCFLLPAVCNGVLLLCSTYLCKPHKNILPVLGCHSSLGCVCFLCAFTLELFSAGNTVLWVLGLLYT